jgi:hypothetical protein
MPGITIAIDDESFQRPAAIAIQQRRAIPMQAEAIVLQALGRWPMPDDAPTPNSRAASAAQWRYSH